MKLRKIGLIAFALVASVFTLNACNEPAEPTLKPNSTTSTVVDTTTSTNKVTSTGGNVTTSTAKPNTTTSAVVVPPATLGSISGKLVCGETLISGATIQLIDSADAIEGTATSTNEGTFTFTNLEDGTYSLKFSFDEDGYALTSTSETLVSSIVVSSHQAVDLGNINFSTGPSYGPLH